MRLRHSFGRSTEVTVVLCCVCAPSEGEWKMRESVSPSEGVRSMLEMETRLQAFSGWCPICAPSEGERKMRESASPSEGVRSMLEMETRLQAFSGQCCVYAPSEGERKMRGSASPSGNAATGVLGAVPHLRTFGR